MGYVVRPGRSRRSRLAQVLALLVLTALVGSASAPAAGVRHQAASPIKIGGVFDITGVAAPYGTAFQRSAAIVFNSVNAHGGVNGHKLVVDYQDDQSDPSTAVAVTTKLISQGNKIIFGGIYTPIALAVANTTVANKVLMYTPGSGATALTTPVQKLVFAATATHDGISRSVVRLAASLKPKSVGFLEMTNTEGTNDKDAVTALLKGYGLTINDDEKIDQAATDATSQILKFKQAGVDVIISSAISGPATALLKAEIQQNIYIPIVDEGGGNTPAVLGIAQSNPKLTYYTTSPIGCQMGTTCTKPFFRLWDQSYLATDATLYAAEGYGSALAFVAALKRAKDFSPNGLAKVLETMPKYNNAILPAALKFSATNHVGISYIAMTGFKNGTAAFFDPKGK
jgi:branched-chain amino acid transport system substrate-binding protein